MRSIIDEINWDYGSDIKYNDIDFNFLVNFFKQISKLIELDENFFKIIDEL